MTHDITHCAGVAEYSKGGFPARKICEKRNTCIRYYAWIEWQTLGNVGLVSHINPEPCIKDDYKLYLKGEEK